MRFVLQSRYIYIFNNWTMDCILAIDMGTTNCKAVVFNSSGKMPFLRKTKPMNTISEAGGKSEQNPTEVFNAVTQLIQESTQKNNNIVAVCFSAAMHSLIAIDERGKPLTNAMLWSDTRAMPGKLQQLKSK